MTEELIASLILAISEGGREILGEGDGGGEPLYSISCRLISNVLLSHSSVSS